jgi:phospholipid/cholesterol/gamma-HCH transport system ATP-binding protein
VSVAPVELRGVSVLLADTLILSNLSLSVRRGDIAVLIGGSGAGKTTVARVILGLVPASEGQVLVEGEDIAKLSESALRQVRAKFGMVFQYSALLDSLSVLDNVALPLREHTKLKEREIRARVSELLAELDLVGSEAQFPAELSGGMRKRVGLARALIRKPSILIYDEPASGLDPLTARRVDDLIKQTRDRFGVTSLVISHDMAQAVTIADRLYLLDKGTLAAEGEPEQLLRDTSSLAGRQFAASRVSFPKAATATP